MEIYLIRHTTPSVVKGAIYGWADVPLADSFEEEKQMVLSQLPADIDYVVSSPSGRCTTLAASISLNYDADKNLRELNFGEWEGMTWDTVNRQELDHWMDDFVNGYPPCGESMLQMEHRVLKVWGRLLKTGYKKIAVVCHGGVIRIIQCRLQGIPLKDAFTIKINYGQIVKVTI